MERQQQGRPATTVGGTVFRLDQGFTEEEFRGLRHRMRYAPLALRMWVPAWGMYVMPIRAISLN